MTNGRDSDIPGGKTLVWLGMPFFAEHLSAHGWRVLRPGFSPSAPYTWNDILALTDGTVPDMVIYGDASVPPPLLGVERFPCLTAFYAVDSHVHSWYPIYAQAFDLCFVSLKEHLLLFTKGRLPESRVFWCPAHARDEHRPPAVHPEPEWDALFVGTTDPALLPARHAFLRALKNRLPTFHAISGNFVELFPKARLIVNECGSSELNFRIFEALGLGCCLLTPNTGPPLTDLFHNGTELFTYRERDPDDCAALARRLLEDGMTRRNVAQAGLRAVDRAHRASHRAAQCHEAVAELLAGDNHRDIIRLRLADAPAIHTEILRLLYLHHAETVPDETLKRAYLAEARCHLP